MNEGLKPCPFCGNIPYIEKRPMWDGARGYYGRYKFDIHCENCGCTVNLGANNTIYTKENEAKNNAIKAWNRRVEE